MPLQINNLISLVNSFSLPMGMQTILDAKLQAALADLHAGDTATACGDLTAFTNEVRAQSGRGLTASQADQLLASAMEIKALLGC